MKKASAMAAALLATVFLGSCGPAGDPGSVAGLVSLDLGGAQVKLAHALDSDLGPMRCDNSAQDLTCVGTIIHTSLTRPFVKGTLVADDVEGVLPCPAGVNCLSRVNQQIDENGAFPLSPLEMGKWEFEITTSVPLEWFSTTCENISDAQSVSATDARAALQVATPNSPQTVTVTPGTLVDFAFPLEGWQCAVPERFWD